MLGLAAQTHDMSRIGGDGEPAGLSGNLTKCQAWFSNYVKPAGMHGVTLVDSIAGRESLNAQSDPFKTNLMVPVVLSLHDTGKWGTRGRNVDIGWLVVLNL
jgi:hypothetical protein